MPSNPPLCQFSLEQRRRREQQIQRTITPPPCACCLCGRSATTRQGFRTHPGCCPIAIEPAPFCRTCLHNIGVFVDHFGIVCLDECTRRYGWGGVAEWIDADAEDRYPSFLRVEIRVLVGHEAWEAAYHAAEREGKDDLPDLQELGTIQAPANELLDFCQQHGADFELSLDEFDWPDVAENDFVVPDGFTEEAIEIPHEMTGAEEDAFYRALYERFRAKEMQS